MIIGEEQIPNLFLEEPSHSVPGGSAEYVGGRQFAGLEPASQISSELRRRRLLACEMKSQSPFCSLGCLPPLKETTACDRHTHGQDAL